MLCSQSSPRTRTQRPRHELGHGRGPRRGHRRERRVLRSRSPRSQAARLQDLRFCRVSPTADSGIWRVTDVTRVGVVAIDDVRLIVCPKTPLRSLIFMASYSGLQAEVDDASFEFEADQGLPAALASAFIGAVGRATGPGATQGVRINRGDGHRDPRSLGHRAAAQGAPGIPVPVELTYDDYTEDVPENRILKAALRALVRMEQLPGRVVDRIGPMLGLFSEVSDLRATGQVMLPRGVAAERALPASAPPRPVGSRGDIVGTRRGCELGVRILAQRGEGVRGLRRAGSSGDAASRGVRRGSAGV